MQLHHTSNIGTVLVILVAEASRVSAMPLLSALVSCIAHTRCSCCRRCLCCRCRCCRRSCYSLGHLNLNASATAPAFNLLNLRLQLLELLLQQGVVNLKVAVPLLHIYQLLLVQVPHAHTSC